MTRSATAVGQNVNKLLQPGWANVSSGIGLPSEAATEYGIIIVFGSSAAYGRLAQLYIPDTNNQMFVRMTYSNGEIIEEITSAWSQIL